VRWSRRPQIWRCAQDRKAGPKTGSVHHSEAAVFEGLTSPSLPILVGVDSTSGLMSRHWLTVVRQRSTARSPGSLTSPPRTLIEDTVLELPWAAASNEAAVVGFLTLSIPRLTNSRRHDGERRFRDWRRDNLSSEDGWLTLRYGWHDTVVESCATAGNLVRVLRRRGYDGELARCTHCNV
jgi:hypothetical protein